MEDEIMRELHAIREKIAEECGYDVHKMFLRQRRIERQWKGKIVTKEELAKSRHAVAGES